jgi:type IV pilus assembly protein PilM
MTSPRMLSTLLGAGAAKRTSIVSIDLGQRTTKAVHVQRKGEGFELLQYSLQDAPISDKTPSPEVLGDHLKAVLESIHYKGRRVALVIGANDALVRNAELPAVPVADMRLMLKYNSKNYLQQDLPDHVFDCHAVGVSNGSGAADAASRGQKVKVWVGGARKQTLDHFQQSARHAGLTLDQIIPCLICPANAFEQAQPEAFSKEVVALVDIGFRNSTIGILSGGELTLSRVVPSLGADRLTSGLAEAMGVSYAEAEGIKVGLPEEVQGAMQGLILPLGRELRASIDFFEHQQDKPVTQVYVSGGSARSNFIIESLQGELMVPTKAWNPISFMNLTVPPQRLAEAEQVAPQLAVAVGGAMAVL